MDMDLTKITTPFGLLDTETKEALKAHGGPYERYSVDTQEGWVDCNFPTWIHYAVYRVKPAHLNKPSIDWSHVAPEFKWMAQDRSGCGWLFKSKPRFGCECALFSDEPGVKADGFQSYTPGTCDWRDSLVGRPE